MLRALAVVCLAAFAREAARAFIETHELVVSDPGQSYQGVRFPAGTRLVLNKEDLVLTAVLGAPATFEGQRWSKDTQLDFHGAGKVHTATLKASQDVHGIRFAAASELHFDSATRKLVVLRMLRGGPMDVRGVRFSTAAVWVQFHPTERVKEGVLDGDQTIGKAGYRGGSRITFHPDGKIRSGFLAETASLDDLRLAPGAVGFYAGGKLRYGELAAPQPVHGVAAKGRFLLYDDGMPEYLCLAERLAVKELLGGDCCAAGTQVHFDHAKKPIGWGGRCDLPVDGP